MDEAEQSDWDVARDLIGRTLSQKGLPVTDLETKCEEAVLRNLRETDVHPGNLISLTSDSPVEGTSCRVWGYVFGTWGIKGAAAGAGYVTIVWGSGAVTYARLLKFKSARDGGNDYAVLDRVKPTVPF